MEPEYAAAVLPAEDGSAAVGAWQPCLHHWTTRMMVASAAAAAASLSALPEVSPEYPDPGSASAPG